MRKVVALALVLGVAVCLPLLAAEAPKTQPAAAAKGAVVAWEAGKSIKIKEHSGKEVEFAVTAATKVVGAPAVGETVVVHYRSVEGKPVASHITVEAKTPAGAPKAATPMAAAAPMAAAPPAEGAEHGRPGHTYSHGMVVGWDEATKTLKVKDQTGKEMVFSVTDKTQIGGKIVTGEMVSVQYAAEGGKNVALHVAAGSGQPHQKGKTTQPAKPHAPAPTPAK